VPAQATACSAQDVASCRTHLRHQRTSARKPPLRARRARRRVHRCVAASTARGGDGIHRSTRMLRHSRSWLDGGKDLCRTAATGGAIESPHTMVACGDGLPTPWRDGEERACCSFPTLVRED
jgi:hypothetical protein